jgi:hypothetical protein
VLDTRPSMLRCLKMEPHAAHEWLCPWQTPTERWCPGVQPLRPSFYFRGRVQGRRFEAMSQPDTGRPLNHA